MAIAVGEFLRHLRWARICSGREEKDVYGADGVVEGGHGRKSAVLGPCRWLLPVGVTDGDRGAEILKRDAAGVPIFPAPAKNPPPADDANFGRMACTTSGTQASAMKGGSISTLGFVSAALTKLNFGSGIVS